MQRLSWGRLSPGGKPSPVLERRIDHALELYRSGDAKKLIFTGGAKDVGEISEAEASRRYALERGVKPEDILIETVSEITEQNLANAKAAAERAGGIETYLIVSDPLHMKRAMRMAEDLGMKAYSSPTTASAYQSLKTKVPFLLREMFFLHRLSDGSPLPLIKTALLISEQGGLRCRVYVTGSLFPAMSRFSGSCFHLGIRSTLAEGAFSPK
nr:YdcF family protein [Paenibacillus sp. DMB20]